MPLSILNSGMSKGTVFDKDILIYEYCTLNLPVYKIAKNHNWSYMAIYRTLKKLGVYKGDTRVGRKYATRKKN